MTSHDSRSTSPAAIVTGGSSGIGLAVAEALLGAGWSVLLTGRSVERLERARHALAERGHDAHRIDLLPGDVGDEAFPAACVGRAVGCFGRLDALVNNAGTGSLVPIPETTSTLLGATFATNVFGPALLIAAAWPHLADTARAHGRATVVNVSSMASHDPFPGFFVYGASKSALDGLTRSAAKEGAPLGIRAFSVNPGAVETPLLRTIVDETVLPPDQALAPAQVATVALDCIAGRRESENGRAILVAS